MTKPAKIAASVIEGRRLFASDLGELTDELSQMRRFAAALNELAAALEADKM